MDSFGRSAALLITRGVGTECPDGSVVERDMVGMRSWGANGVKAPVRSLPRARYSG
jgi:hypothetical protein